MTSRVISLARYHDGTAKTNWGGRATSLALAKIATANPGVTLGVPVTGRFIISHLEGDDQATTPAAPSRGQLLRAALRGTTPAAPTTAPPIPWGTEDEFAARIIAAPASKLQRLLVAALSDTDELWMNGEGDFIMSDTRRTLWRTMVIMSVARQLGKPVRLLNSILSVSPGDDVAPEPVRLAVGTALRQADTIMYRDPASFALHEELYADVAASWAPDALFHWASPTPFPTFGAESAFGPFAETLPFSTQQFLLTGEPYVTISGSSSKVELTDAVKKRLADLVTGLRAAGLRTVFVATDSRDVWLRGMADSLDAFFVESRVPLAIGMSVLAGSRAFISGRYHPSILAAGLGVPTVFMASNSHKTRSLQDILEVANPVEFGFLDRDDEQAALLATSLEAAATDDAGRQRIRETAVRAGLTVRDAVATI